MHLILLLFILPYSAAQFLGPADIDIERLEICPELLLETYINITMSKINRTHMGIDANMNLPYDLDQNVALNLTTSKWGDGGWKPNFLTMYDPDGCSFLEKYVTDQLHEFLKALNHKESCPISKGNYIINKHVISTKLSIPIMYGKFLAEAAFIKDNVTFACFRLYVSSKPKNFFGKGK